jgi:hypothetical protein
MTYPLLIAETLTRRRTLAVKKYVYLTLLGHGLLAMVISGGCAGNYYARTFEENRVRQLAEDAAADVTLAAKVEAEISRENRNLEGLIAQISLVNSQSRTEAEQCERKMKKLGVPIALPAVVKKHTMHGN